MNPSLHRALQCAEQVTGITIREILSPARLRPVVQARWLVMRQLADLGWSTTRIGKALNRDHSTVVHGLREIEKTNLRDAFNRRSVAFFIDGQFVERVARCGE